MGNSGFFVILGDVPGLKSLIFDDQEFSKTINELTDTFGRSLCFTYWRALRAEVALLPGDNALYTPELSRLRA